MQMNSYTYFDDLQINNDLKKALKEMEMTTMTSIQSQSIPHILNGKDIMGASKTGSGKTLAFLVPLINKLVVEDSSSRRGTLAIILSPVRDLSMQIFDQLKKLTKHTKITSGLIIGGNDRNEEVKILREGLTIIVATPGRLLDHLNNTSGFDYSHLHTLVIDEADRLIMQGFLIEMRAIISKLPKNRQTLLFSATLNIGSAKFKEKMKKLNDVDILKKKKTTTQDKIIKLACYSLNSNCVFVDLSKTDNEESGERFTNSQLKEMYVITELKNKFRALYTFLVSIQNKKTIVFMSTNAEVVFYSKLLAYIDLPNIFALYGKQTNAKRTKNLNSFKTKKVGVLFCTDVAARGLDIPVVDWVVQYDAPPNHLEYVHRVGRTARAGKEGSAMLFLHHQERRFVELLLREKIQIEQMHLEPDSLCDIQKGMETLVTSTHDLLELAISAYQAINFSYKVNKLPCFKNIELTPDELRKTLGLDFIPKLNENIAADDHREMCKQKRKYGDQGISDNEELITKKKMF